MKLITLLTLLELISFSAWAVDCSCDHTLSPDQSYFDGIQMKVQPGDRVCFPAGARQQVRLKNFVGTASDPITFVNCGGQVTIKGNAWYAIAIDQSAFFRITGSGDPDQPYGIKVSESGTMGIQIGEYSTDFEVDHIEITNVGFAGVMAKTDPMCERPDLRDFVQKNTVLHDLYIHDISGEGMYIGYSWYPVREGVDCDGNLTQLYPHRLEGVKIYNNILSNTGWDGIQVGCATQAVKIHNNIIKNYGTAHKQYQDNGMQIGAGTTGKVYNNYIVDGMGEGSGLIVFGIGDNMFYNNVIANSGSYGVYLNDKGFDTSRQPYYFMNNTIVLSKAGGIRMSLVNSHNSLFVNNLIVDPTGQHLQGGDSHRTQENNILYNQVDQALFVNPALHDYRLKASSPAIDAGKNVAQYGITQGLAGISRPQGLHYDVGAYEFTLDSTLINFLPYPIIVLSADTEPVEPTMLYPNPTSGVFYLNIPFSESTQLTITDLNGKIIQQPLARPTNEGTMWVDVRPYALSRGLYHLRIESGAKLQYLRFYKR